MLGSPNHPAVTIHFLNAILQPSFPITEVQILNPIQGKERPDDKLVVLDILAKDAAYRQFNVEMQTTLPVALNKRLAFYNCLNYVRQISEGDQYEDLHPAISICVINRIVFRHEARYHLSFRLRCDQTGLVFLDDLEFHTLELPKFEAVDDNIDSLSAQEKWMYLLRHAADADPDQLSELLGDPEFREAVGVLEMISQSPEDRQFYESRLKFLRDEEAKLIAARKEGRDEGHRAGVEKGKLAGRVQTLQELLGDPIGSDSALLARPVDELHGLIAELQEQFRRRKP